jgi:hypothetical protein
MGVLPFLSSNASSSTPRDIPGGLSFSESQSRLRSPKTYSFVTELLMRFNVYSDGRSDVLYCAGAIPLEGPASALGALGGRWRVIVGVAALPCVNTMQHNVRGLTLCAPEVTRGVHLPPPPPPTAREETWESRIGG